MSRRSTLDAAYRQAHYVVQAPGAPLVLHVGEHQAALAALLGRADPPTAALLTAHNPGSRRVDPAANAAATAALRAALAGYRTFPGESLDPAGRWPPEDSVLVLGISIEAARAVAARFGQNALLWVDAHATPELVWLK